MFFRLSDAVEPAHYGWRGDENEGGGLFAAFQSLIAAGVKLFVSLKDSSLSVVGEEQFMRTSRPIARAARSVSEGS